jgi:SAM-dependent methyltransferase
MPFADDEFDIIVASHTLEHIRNILPLMQELHRVAKPGALFHIRVPFGGCSIAFEDPTHVRQFFPKSFEYFGQMAYNVADYNYRGDWEPLDIMLSVNDEFQGMHPDELAFMIERAFNVAKEMFVTLQCIKPIRVADGKPRSMKVKFGFESDIKQQLTGADPANGTIN